MSAFLKALAGLCLLRAVFKMLLPKGDTRAIVDFALGLMEVLCMLNALINLLRGAL